MLFPGFVVLERRDGKRRPAVINARADGGCREKRRMTMKREKRIAWICLIVAGLLEIVWAYFMKQSHGFTVLLPSIATVISLIPSFFLLEKGIRQFGIGMAYAVFTGIGIAGTTVIGILLLGESVSAAKIISLLVLVAGILGLKFCEDDDGGRESAV